MAIHTLATAATLAAVQWTPGGLSTADMATMANGILNDAVNFKTGPLPIYSTAFTPFGQLYIPNRGFLTLKPGDYVAVDATTGWPILVSNLAVNIGALSGSSKWTFT
jgi:hypothetical protein